MFERIQSILKELGIEHSIIRRRHIETAELFFIRKKLDMRRIKDTTVYPVFLYHDFTDGGAAMRGSSEVLLSPDMSDEELRRTLADGYRAAAHVKNPTYELYAGKKEEPVAVPSTLAGLPLAESARRMSAALFAPDTRDDAFLNSAELFVTRTEVALVSSAGAEVSFTKYSCNGEFVVQCRQPTDVEQYFSFSYEGLDEAALTQKVAEALSTVCDRAKASESPKAGSYDIVLSGRSLRELLQFYLTRADASMVYAHYSTYRPGDAVQGETVTGEKLDMTVLPRTPYSVDGIPMAERPLIEGGTLRFLHGATRFCRYLGTEPTGSYSRIRLGCGTVPFDELKKGCLYPVSFSDFQMNALDGRFGGEIRLAYLFTDDGVKLLTGGSVNGSLLEKQGGLTFSTERYTDADYTGPFAVRIAGVSVSGK